MNLAFSSDAAPLSGNKPEEVVTMSPERTNRPTATIEEVADTFGIARSTAYMLAKQNRLPVPVIRLGRRMVVSRAAIEMLLAKPGESSATISRAEAV